MEYRVPVLKINIKMVKMFYNIFHENEDREITVGVSTYLRHQYCLQPEHAASYRHKMLLHANGTIHSEDGQ